MKTLKHEEIGGGYSIRKKIIIDACEISDGKFDVMALYENGEELEEIETDTEAEAIQAFNKMFEKYAGELQKALYGKLETGKKYTIVYLGEFGFPIAQKNNFSFYEVYNICTIWGCCKDDFHAIQEKESVSEVFL